jgi:ACT domain-containing protein
MGELGSESLVLSLLKKYPGCSDDELIEKSGLSRGTYYRYKRILRAKGAI